MTSNLDKTLMLSSAIYHLDHYKILAHSRELTEDEIADRRLWQQRYEHYKPRAHRQERITFRKIRRYNDNIVEERV